MSQPNLDRKLWAQVPDRRVEFKRFRLRNIRFQRLRFPSGAKTRLVSKTSSKTWGKFSIWRDYGPISLESLQNISISYQITSANSRSVRLPRGGPIQI